MLLIFQLHNTASLHLHLLDDPYTTCTLEVQFDDILIDWGTVKEVPLFIRFVRTMSLTPRVFLAFCIRQDFDN